MFGVYIFYLYSKWSSVSILILFPPIPLFFQGFLSCAIYVLFITELALERPVQISLSYKFVSAAIIKLLRYSETPTVRPHHTHTKFFQMFYEKKKKQSAIIAEC